MADGALGKVYKPGEVIVRQGELGDCMYVIQAGRVEVLMEQEGEEVSLAVREAGDIIGEMAIFEKEVRSATIRALDEVRILTVDKKNLLRRIHQDPSLAYHIVQTMSSRIRELSLEVAQLRAPKPVDEREDKDSPNVRQAVPFFGVTDIQESVHFYVHGLGFEITNQWVFKGKLQWCWLQLEGAALMLQEFRTEGHGSYRPQGKLGQGVTIYFICEDALKIYHDITARGIQASKPFVGNGMWVITITDLDGYQVIFESQTDVAEETVYSDALNIPPGR